MTRVLPQNDANAITSVVFAIELDGQLDGETLSDLTALHAKLKNELPRRRESRSLVLQVDATIGLAGQGASQIGMPGEVSGITFDSVKKDGQTEWAISANKGALLCVCASYTRWSLVWPRAWAFLSEFGRTIGGRARVAAVGLQFTDEFVAEVPPNEFRAGSVFNAASRHLVAAATEKPGLWHVHFGFFGPAFDSEIARQLNVVNVDVVGESDVITRDTTRVKVTSNHRTVLSSAASLEQWLGVAHNSGDVGRAMEAMHATNKDVLRDLLNEAVCKSIDLR